MKIKPIFLALTPLLFLSIGCQPVSNVEKIEMMKNHFLMEKDTSFSKEKFTLHTCYAGGRDRLTLSISRNPNLEVGKGICGSAYNNFIKNNKTLINDYLFDTSNQVKVQTVLDRHAGGVDKVLYTSDKLKALIDFSNYCNIINAFERVIPYSKRENMPEQIAWLLKEQKQIRPENLADYLQYLCPYGSLTQLDGNKAQFTYEADHTAYTIHMRIFSLKELEEFSSSYHYQFKEKGKALSSKYNKVAPIILRDTR